MKYTFVKQHDSTDCGAACMAMVCQYYKKETSITSLRDAMGTDVKGTNLMGMAKCAENLGFTCQAVRVDREGFTSKYTLPAIASTVTKEGLTHFVVIFKVKGERVVIGDPARDLRRITIDSFYKRFTGVLLLLIPNEKFNAEKIKTKGMFERYLNLLLPQKKIICFCVDGIIPNNVVWDSFLSV